MGVLFWPYNWVMSIEQFLRRPGAPVGIGAIGGAALGEAADDHPILGALGGAGLAALAQHYLGGAGAKALPGVAAPRLLKGGSDTSKEAALTPSGMAALKGGLTNAAIFGLPAAAIGALTADEGHRGEAALKAGLGAGIPMGLLGGYGSHVMAGGGPVFHPKMESVAPWMKGVKTKAEAKAAYRSQAKQHHPDRGGSADKMKQVNDQWDQVQNHPHFSKLAAAYLRGRQRAVNTFFGLTP